LIGIGAIHITQIGVDQINQTINILDRDLWQIDNVR
jgi:hypothetical protein